MGMVRVILLLLVMMTHVTAVFVVECNATLASASNTSAATALAAEVTSLMSVVATGVKLAPTELFLPPRTVAMTFSLPSLEEAALVSAALRSTNFSRGKIDRSSIRTRVHVGTAEGTSPACTEIAYVDYCAPREVLVSAGVGGALLLGIGIGICLRRKIAGWTSKVTPMGHKYKDQPDIGR